MNKNIDPEFEEFLQGKKAKTTSSQDNKILEFVHKDLDPSRPIVFLKLALIQTIVGLLTLFFCPQFEISWTSNYEFFHILHRNLGPMACMAVCGTVFMGTGAFVASALLRFSEIQLILNSKYLLHFSLSGIALIFFLLAGAEVYFSFAIPWIVGASVSSILAFDGIKLLRILILRGSKSVAN